MYFASTGMHHTRLGLDLLMEFQKLKFLINLDNLPGREAVFLLLPFLGTRAAPGRTELPQQFLARGDGRGICAGWVPRSCMLLEMVLVLLVLPSEHGPSALLVRFFRGGMRSLLLVPLAFTTRRFAGGGFPRGEGALASGM